MEPLRFISLAVEGALPITSAKRVGPPNASMMSATDFICGDTTEILLSASTRFLYAAHANIAFMGESNDRLRQARERAGFPSARAAASRFGWNHSTYASHENGQTPVPTREAPKYARAFKVSPGWILTGEGGLKNRNIVRVMGRIGAGAEISPEEEQIPPNGLEEIEVPFPLPDNAIAFEVQGESMWPRYDPGDVVVCLNRERDPAELIGWEAAVKLLTGQRYLKRLRSGARRGLYDLESFNAEPIRGVRISWASEVHSVVRAGQWRSLNDAGRKRLVGRLARGRE